MFLTKVKDVKIIITPTPYVHKLLISPKDALAYRASMFIASCACVEVASAAAPASAAALSSKLIGACFQYSTIRSLKLEHWNAILPKVNVY